MKDKIVLMRKTLQIGAAIGAAIFVGILLYWWVGALLVVEGKL